MSDVVTIARTFGALEKRLVNIFQQVDALQASISGKGNPDKPYGPRVTSPNALLPRIAHEQAELELQLDALAKRIAVVQSLITPSAPTTSGPSASEQLRQLDTRSAALSERGGD